MMTVTGKIKITGLLLTAFAAAALGRAAVAADRSGDAAARAGIQAMFDKAQAILVRGGSPKEFADTFYEDDLMISGQGVKTYRSLSAFMDTLALYTKDGGLRRCEVKIIDPIRHSGKLATAFVQEHCAAAKAGETGDDTRLLFVFRNGPHGWRVTQEIVVEGVF